MKNRLAWPAAIAGSLLVTGGLIHYATGSDKASMQRPRTASPARGQPIGLGYGQRNLGIAYGTIPREVLRQLGPPTAKQANCWLYRGRVGRIRGRFSGSYVDAMKFCFSEGPAGGEVVMQILSHMPRHTIVKRDPFTQAIVSKKTYPARWGPPITLAQVPPWYVQQNS